MDRRLITPFDESPSIEYLERMEGDYEGMELSQLTESQMATKETPGKKVSKKPKKIRNRTKSTGNLCRHDRDMNFNMCRNEIFKCLCM